jgi:3-ketosteroid 9alpha-monooxygenase subunit B
MKSEPTYELQVSRIVEETAEARSFVLALPESLAATFRYRAGQFLTFELELDGRKLRRCYSMSSAPEIDKEIKFTVKRVAGGPASNWFNDHVRTGTRLRVLAPSGRFTLTEASGPLLFFAGGSGITPIMSLIKTALRENRGPLRVLYANRDRPAIIFATEIEALAQRHAERLELAHHLDEESGLLGAETVRRMTAGAERAHAYLCGPAPFMALVEETLLGLGFPRERIFIERFLSPVEEIEAAAPSAHSKACRMTVHIDGKSQVIEVMPDETLLQATRRAGLDPPSACEEGICGTCLARLRAGRATMRGNQLLNDREIAEGLILTCQALAESESLEIAY